MPHQPPLPTAFELLAPLVARGVVLDLDAMRDALHAFGDPQNGIPCVHIAGTNGKGSVTAMLDAVLRASGLRVGRYTSPHLHRFVERIAVDGSPVTEDTAREAVREVLDAIDAKTCPPLTFFEAATLAAWLAFRRAQVSFAVMEVGLGGRLDATNVCAPRVTVITRIARDHMALLGDTLAAIATEKAGILKPGVPCVLGPNLHPSQNPEARAAIESVAARVGAQLLDAPMLPYALAPDGRLSVEIDGKYIPVNLYGDYQAENVSTAVAACRALALSPRAVAEGLSAVRWPARMERIDDVIFDAAHNPDGARALATALAHERVGAMVYGASRDKDYAEMLATLGALVSPEKRFFAAANMARAEDPVTLARLAGGTACDSPAEALALARANVRPGEAVVVCGSIFLVAAVRAALLGLAQDPPIPM